MPTKAHRVYPEVFYADQPFKAYAVCYTSNNAMFGSSEDVTYWYIGADGTIDTTVRHLQKMGVQSWSTPRTNELRDIAKKKTPGKNAWNWRKIEVNDIKHTLLHKLLTKEIATMEASAESDREINRLQGLTVSPVARPIFREKEKRGLTSIVNHINDALAWSELALNSITPPSAASADPAIYTPMYYQPEDYSSVFSDLDYEKDIGDLRKGIGYLQKLIEPDGQARLGGRQLNGLSMLHSYLRERIREQEPDAIVSYDALHDSNVADPTDIVAAAKYVMQLTAYYANKQMVGKDESRMQGRKVNNAIVTA